MVNLCQYRGVFKVTAHWQWWSTRQSARAASAPPMSWYLGGGGGWLPKHSGCARGVHCSVLEYKISVLTIFHPTNTWIHWLKLCHHNLAGTTTAHNVVLLFFSIKKKSIKLQFICLFIFIFCTWKNFVSVLKKSWNLIISKCVGTNRTLVLPSAHPPVSGRVRP